MILKGTRNVNVDMTMATLMEISLKRLALKATSLSTEMKRLDGRILLCLPVLEARNAV
jgi:hypothetical protein